MRIVSKISFASFSALYTIVKAQSSLRLFVPLPPADSTDSTDSDAFSIATPTAWANPIGTAADGSETTFLYNEIDGVEGGLFGDIPTGTATVATTSFTVVASASGFRIPDLDSVSAECTLDSSNSGGCVYVDVAEVGQTSLVTVSEPGLSFSVYEIPISSPVLAVETTSTGTVSFTTGSSTSSSSSTAHNGARPAQQLTPFIIGSLVAGLYMGVSLVL
ncbi:hypothetical protein D9757_010837 [Collybiopsis confluens]|uniref:Uncharacterized protein n=1 Tax=Collybiopsis confluens TaxID=2823264 RepID=A0A8H5LRP7_9AGAR|nr:hypothetical protein D9757_010837 [Collybiopsis confluens]